VGTRAAADESVVSYCENYNSPYASSPPVGEGSFELSVDVLLELFHVEELERLLRLQKSAGQLEKKAGVRKKVLSGGPFGWRVSFHVPQEDTLRMSLLTAFSSSVFLT